MDQLWKQQQPPKNVLKGITWIGLLIVLTENIYWELRLFKNPPNTLHEPLAATYAGILPCAVCQLEGNWNHTLLLWLEGVQNHNKLFQRSCLSLRPQWHAGAWRQSGGRLAEWQAGPRPRCLSWGLGPRGARLGAAQDKAAESVCFSFQYPLCL